MPTVETIALQHSRSGTQRQLKRHRFGQPGARPKVYVQASLHADEIPGMLTARHLLDRLTTAERAGDLRGEIVVVPVANPVGLDQVVNGQLLGRFALPNGGNFNRDYPDLAAEVADAVRGRLGADLAANVGAIRTALRDALAKRTAKTELESLRLLLIREAVDADIVLDLHCDDDAVLHLYVGTPLWPDCADLAAQLGAEATFLATESGGNPFDEACSGVWWRLRDLLDGEHPIPNGCLAATVELRGRPHVEDDLARADADNLFRFLQRRGAVAGDPGPLPPLVADATPLSGAELPSAPMAGIVAYRVKLGAHVAKGDVIADLVDPLAGPGEDRRPILAGTDGRLIVRRVMKYASAGDSVAMIAGTEPLRAGRLLSD